MDCGAGGCGSYSYPEPSSESSESSEESLPAPQNERYQPDEKVRNKSSSSIVASKRVVSARDAGRNYDALIDAQHTSGYWKESAKETL